MPSIQPIRRLRNGTTGETVAVDAHLSQGFIGALMGLIGKKGISMGYALGIERCNQVHTYGVRFPIDIAYCDSSGRVLLIVSGLPPNRISPRASGAEIAWEMASGGLEGRVSEGDILTLD